MYTMALRCIFDHDGHCIPNPCMDWTGHLTVSRGVAWVIALHRLVWGVFGAPSVTAQCHSCLYTVRRPPQV